MHRLCSAALFSVFLLAVGSSGAGEPPPPSAEENLQMLLGKDGKTGVWELQGAKKGTTVRLSFRPRNPRAPAEAASLGQVTVDFPAGMGDAGFGYRLEGKGEERFLVVQGQAFKEEARIPYKLEDGKLQLQGGTAAIPAWESSS